MNGIIVELRTLGPRTVAVYHPKGGGLFTDIKYLKHRSKIAPREGETCRVYFTEEQYKQMREMAEESRSLMD